MAYSNVSMVEEISYLIQNNSDITDTIIRNYIRRADARINLALASRYATPILKSSDYYLTGTISVLNGQVTVTGSGTSFTDELSVGDTIQVIGTREPIRVSSIESDTSFTATANIETTASGKQFFTIPDEIVTASEYLAAHQIIIEHFSEQAYNQDTVSFNTQYKEIALPLIEELDSGRYYNTELVAQTASKTVARFTVINKTNDLRTFVDDSYDSIFKNAFK